MGCDIHFVVEKKFDDRWVGVYSTCETPCLINYTDADRSMTYDPKEDSSTWEAWLGRDPHGWYSFARRPIMKSRNYAFFARLASVRGKGPKAKGVPDDASELTRVLVERWGRDGHSHSHDPLYHFVRKWLESVSPRGVAMLTMEQLGKGHEFLNWLTGLYDYDELDNYRVVYWFDN